MRDDAPELGPIAFHFHEGVAKLALLRALRKRFLQQTTEPVLLPLDPEDVLDFLSGTRGVQEHATHDFVARETACASDAFEVGRVRVREAHRNPMFELPHLTSIDIAIVLSREKVGSHARISRRR